MEKTTSNEESAFKDQRENKETFKHLVKLESEVKKEIEEQEAQQRKATFYKALDTIIDLKLSVEEVNQRFETISDVFISMATGDFSKRLEINVTKNLFTWLATNVNMVNDELQRNVVKNNFLEEALELTSDMALMTNTKGVIIYANSASTEYLNQTKDNIITLGIANIFESKTQFGVAKKEGEKIENVKVMICPYNSKSFPAELTIKEVVGLEGIDGYLYQVKKIRG